MLPSKGRDTDVMKENSHRLQLLDNGSCSESVAAPDPRVTGSCPIDSQSLIYHTPSMVQDTHTLKCFSTWALCLSDRRGHPLSDKASRHVKSEAVPQKKRDSC
ncbi:hypothetical protein Q8A73_000065 [Channa argus]|nr:hypothetical protein Q8A73_000065 [Channa argus]